jgi:HK97 family phage prohead protease
MPNVGRNAPDKTHTQSVCLYKDKWSKEDAKKWCKDHDYYVDGLDETDLLFRFRQYDPDEDKFRYRNQVITKDSIFLVVGYLKGSQNTMNVKKELRYMPFEEWELREEANKPPKLVGYASVFNQEAEIFGLWREKVAPGAFKRTIAQADIRALWNHNTDLVLGRNKANPPTLSLKEDDHGLKVEIIPPDTQAGRDAVTSIKRGDVSQMSISFQIVKQEWFTPDDKKVLPLRTISEMKLFEVSPVTFPAFEQTTISARSVMEPETENDPREQALFLSLEADHGLELTTEQRQIIAKAVELYQPYLLDSEPDPEDPGHHSGPETDSELDEGHYSALERLRRLSELEKEFQTGD